jgi:hypothetical protein
MSTTSTSIGRGPAHGGNENHGADPTHTTLGEDVQQEPPAGNDLADEEAPEIPVDSPGARVPKDKGADL